jgi:hypothetical protein
VSDFLSNLAARTLGPATLAPRIRLRFEPLAPPEEADPDHPVALVRTEPAESHAEAVPPNAKEGIEAQEHASPQTMVQPPTALLPVRELRLPRAPADKADPMAPAPPPVHSPDLAPPPPVSPAPAQHPMSAPTLPEPSAEPVVGVPLPRVEERSERPSAERAQGDRRPKPRPRHRYDLGWPAAAPREAARAPVRRSVARPAPAVPAEEEERVVQVSIGRIEVRAVGPTSQPAAARSSGAMTIEEYIAKRRDRR